MADRVVRGISGAGMRSFGRWPAAHIWTALVVVWVVAAWAVPSHAGGPNDLCAAEPAAGAFTADPAATTALERIAAAVERRLSANDAPLGDDEIAKLTATLDVAGIGLSLALIAYSEDDARYRSGDSKSEALRQAQLSLLADPRYQRPNYWAAFALIGGWR